MRAPTFAPWLLLLLTYDSPKRSSTVNAFVVHQVPLTHLVTPTLRHAVCLATNNQDDDTPQTDTSNNRQIGVGRRGTLMTLLGGAVSFAAGDLALYAAAVKATGVAGNAVVTAGGGLYERVLAFGNKYRGAAIASEELTAWIATQKVALTPEIRSWLAAQKRLQLVRKTAMATAAASRAKTTTRAAVIGGGGGVVEEGILAAAATAAVKSISQTQDTDAISSNDENDLNTQNTEITDALEAKEESTSLTTSSTDKNTLDDSISPSANEDEPLS
jgi:hypothetical protein